MKFIRYMNCLEKERLFFMILSALNAVSCSYRYPEEIEKALNWLKNNDLAAMETGTYEIEGKDIYAMIQEITTQPFEQRRAEKHDEYVDVQCIISGTERMGYATYTGMEEISENPEGKDICFFKNVANENYVDVPAGAFCIFFTNDIHRPGAAAGEPAAVRKAIVKVRESLLKK